MLYLIYQNRLTDRDDFIIIHIQFINVYILKCNFNF